MSSRLSLSLLLLVSPATAGVATIANGTTYALFWRGDLRIIATRPNTSVTLIDINTGLPLDTTMFLANVPGNPFVLANAGDSFEGESKATPTGAVLTHRVRVIASNAAPPVEDKPIAVFTGALAAGLKHPLSPPTTTNAWLSYIPAVGAVAGGAEVGREFWGFTTRELHVFARKGPLPTSIVIQDLVTNVEVDSDDSIVLDPSSPYLIADDGYMEVYYLDGFEDDTVHVIANTDVSLLAGVASLVAPDWTVTPPSWGSGEDFRELGTLFYAHVGRDLTIFPTQNDTLVQITDVSDGDDSTFFTLANGDLTGDYDIFTASLTTLVARAAAPAVSIQTLGASGPFDNDIVRIAATKPILVYVGPKTSDTSEYSDVAYSIQTGPSAYLTYAYAQNGGAEDYQMFSLSATTNVQITSLSYTSGFGSQAHHDFSIPVPTNWLGGNVLYDDWYWASPIWAGELLRITSDGPVAVMNGDYDGPNFGCFIPYVYRDDLLPPIAAAGPDLDLCPADRLLVLDGGASFDQDTQTGPLTPEWWWDTDAAIDRDMNGNPTDDRDASGAVVPYLFPADGTFVVTLTFIDDEGVADSDVREVRIGTADLLPPTLSCPPIVRVAPTNPDSAWVPLVANVSDDCDPNPAVINDRTALGRDASDEYPCGSTTVEFVARDLAGRESRCTSIVDVVPLTAPGRLSGPTRAARRNTDIAWSLARDLAPGSASLRLYRGPDKPVSPALRTQVASLPYPESATIELGAITSPPSLVYYQAVAVSCDGVLVGPY